MLDIHYIRENLKEVTENITHRNLRIDLTALLELDDQRKILQSEGDDLRAKRKAGSKGKPTSEQIEEMKKIGEKIKHLETTQKEVLEAYQDLLMQVPNKTHPESPIGGEEDFVVRKTKGLEPKLKNLKDHEELLTTAGLIDFERGAKVVGSKFYYSKNGLVRLNQALLNFGMDVLEEHGFEFVETPDLAKEEILIGAGFHPRGEEDQIYTVAETDLALIGTAEITMLGYHANETLDLSNGPKKYAAISHCFRKEAGAYGRTSKGLYRVHQFSKLEMFVFCTPEQSEELHEHLRTIEEEICDKLGLHYRVIDIPTGDLGAPAYRKYDIEAWMSMKGDNTQAGDFGEITSTSNCLDYQARRLNIKYKNAEGASEFVHTLNGTAIVLSRFPIAIVEQFQTADGNVTIPEILRPYMGGKEFLM